MSIGCLDSHDGTKAVRRTEAGNTQTSVKHIQCAVTFFTNTAYYGITLVGIEWSDALWALGLDFADQFFIQNSKILLVLTNATDTSCAH
jgi:hypothetical protein